MFRSRPLLSLHPINRAWICLQCLKKHCTLTATNSTMDIASLSVAEVSNWLEKKGFSEEIRQVFVGTYICRAVTIICPVGVGDNEFQC